MDLGIRAEVARFDMKLNLNADLPQHAANTLEPQPPHGSWKGTLAVAMNANWGMQMAGD